MKEPGHLLDHASKRVLKLSVLLLLTLQNTALVLVTKYSYRTAATMYYVSTVIACSECLKLIVSFVLIVFCDGRAAAKTAIREIPASVAHLSLPAVLYVVQNTLLFDAVKLLNPMVYTACSQSKILTSAFFGVVMLKSRITKKQLLSLCALVLGMILVQSEYTTHGDKNTDSGTSLRGLVFAFTASITSGFAGTYLEKMYKTINSDGSRQSIWFRNAQLASFSLPIAICTAYWRDGTIICRNGIFTGYDGFVVVIIVLQAIGGLISAAVMRYATNVLKCFAVSLSICSCALATTYVFDDGHTGLSVHQYTGILLVIGATFTFAAKKT